MTKPGRILLALIFMLGFHSLTSEAGWIITEVIHYPDGNSSDKNTMYFQDNIIKCVEESHTVIYDLNNREITFINPALKVYWKGSLDKYVRKVKEMALEHFEREMEKASPEDRQYYEAIYENLKIELEQDSNAVVFRPDVNIEIVMTDENELFLGYDARKYEIYENGFLREELWLTTEIGLSKDFDAQKFRSFINEMAWGVMSTDYQSAPEYINLMQAGLVLRSVEYLDNGSSYRSEVLDVVQNEIPHDRFYPPKDYQLVSLNALGLSD